MLIQIAIRKFLSEMVDFRKICGQSSRKINYCAIFDELQYEDYLQHNAQIHNFLVKYHSPIWNGQSLYLSYTVSDSRTFKPDEKNNLRSMKVDERLYKIYTNDSRDFNKFHSQPIMQYVRWRKYDCFEQFQSFEWPIVMKHSSFLPQLVTFKVEYKN